MHLKYRGVNQAFNEMIRGIRSGVIPTVTSPSRNGEVQVVEEPVIVTFQRPLERVLLNEVRDANPFFHLYESLWMLAGRNDVAPLAYYNGKIKDYSDDGATFNGAYGRRWRGTGRLDAFGRGSPDQLEILISHLKQKPDSRRAVLSIWNVEDDLHKLDTTKDNACNVCAMFSVELGKCSLCEAKPHLVGSCSKCGGKPHDLPRYLNMTVCNRSNDLIWGLLGANVVHFSFLQEYMAAHLGLECGVYNQMTNNCHVYTWNWKPEEWLKWEDNFDRRDDPYEADDFKAFPLVSDPATFDRELPKFVERHSKDAIGGQYNEPFLVLVAQPMMVAFHYYKRKEYDVALQIAGSIVATDWKQAATSWIRRRKERKEAKDGVSPGTL